MQDVGERLYCDRILVTRGENGSVCFTPKEGLSHIPALTTNVVDRIGAGDAVFSIAALCAAQEAPMEIVGLIGNVAGADAVATIGHRTSIQRARLTRHIETLLK